MLNYLKIIGLVVLLSVDNAFSQDNTKPDMPVLDSVSVDYGVSSTHVVLGWNPSDSLDTKGYYIYRNEGTGGTTNWQVLDSVLGRTSSTYTDIVARSNTQKESYRIAAFDSSRNISPMTEAHSTIYLSLSTVVENCIKQVRLSWTAYTGFSVKEYRIYRQRNGAALTYLASVDGSQTAYTDIQLSDSSTYCYVVQAIASMGYTSSSNKKCIDITLPGYPKNLVALNASVVSKNTVSLSFLVDATAQAVGYYKIMRSASVDGAYLPITTIDFSSSLTHITYSDSVADSLLHYYKIEAYSSCGQVLKSSNVISTIVINTSTDESFRHKLYWNDIEDWPGGISHIKLHCVNDGNDSVVYAVSRAQGFVHKMKDLDLRNNYYSGKFTYYVVYYEDENEYGYQDSSKSNEVDVYEMPRVYVPNAFTPLIKTDPVNNTFKPIASFISRDQYIFIVYDRWGQPVFQTENPEEGWNGKTIKGKPVAPDTYVYFVEYTDSKGVLYEQNGSVRVFE